MSDKLISKAIGKLRSKKAVGGSPARKALQSLQVSASDENLLVSPGMMRQTGKRIVKPPEETFKKSKDEEYGSKEHLLRKSKRKNILSQSEVKEMQNEDNPSKNPKMKISKVPKVKKAPKDKKSKLGPVDLNQSCLDSYVSVASKSNEVTIPIKREVVSESSIFQDDSVDNAAPFEETTIRVFRSTSDESNMLTSDVPDVTYWKMLAEQQKSAIETVLIENEQLKDELEVLSIENGQLKNTLHELEKVVEVINACLE